MNLDLVAIINFVLIAGVIQGFVFNLVTLLSKKKFNKVILYLNLTVLFISLNNLQAWLIHKDFFSDIFYLKHFLVPWYLLILPAFYSFLRYFLKIQNVIKGYMKITVVLFMSELILRFFVISYVYFLSEASDISIIKTYTDIEDVTNLVFMLFVFYKANSLVFKKQNTYKAILSYDDLSWIKLFLKLGSLVLLCWVIALTVYLITGIKSGYIFLRLSESILLYWIGYQGFYRYNVVRDRIMLRRNLAGRNIDLNFEPSSQLNNDKHAQEFEKISSYIIEKQRFLDSNLTLNSLSEELSVSTSHLSKIINNYSGYNFSDFINSLRVEQAKQFLIDPSFNHYTIISIGLECGFNSKSTFYSAFKKFTLLTPTEFQEQLNVG